MSHHTPRPWHVTSGTDGAAIHAGVTIASVPIDAADWKANARLIAAAPELLEACKLLVESFLTGEHYKVTNPHLRPCVKRAKAAIDKATWDN